jgi:hypothetical protein
MKENIHTLNTEGKNNTNLSIIVEVFNKYFGGVTDTIHKQIKVVKMKKPNQLTI